MLLEFEFLYRSRYELYKGIQDWTGPAYEISADDGEDENPEKNVEAEATFQSDILKNVQSYKNKLKSVSISGDSKGFVPPIFQNIPLGLMFSEMAEERYPEILVALEGKKLKAAIKEDVVESIVEVIEVVEPVVKKVKVAPKRKVRCEFYQCLNIAKPSAAFSRAVLCAKHGFKLECLLEDDDTEGITTFELDGRLIV